MNTRHPGLPSGLALMVMIVVADQVSKYLVIEFMASRGFVAFDITAYVRLVMVWNSGISFGVFSAGDTMLRWGLTILAFGVAAGLVVWMSRPTDRWQRFAAAFVAGGAVGNGIDRIVHGAVADFIDLHVGGWSWPAFNVADSAITIGVAILVFDTLLMNRSRRKVAP